MRVEDKMGKVCRNFMIRGRQLFQDDPNLQSRVMLEFFYYPQHYGKVRFHEPQRLRQLRKLETAT
jgi:hypothetical protein